MPRTEEQRDNKISQEPRARIDDPRVHEFRNARAATLQGLSAPNDAHDRYLASIGPYLELCAEDCPITCPVRREYMALLVYGDEEGPGLPLGAVLAAFRATEEDAAWIRDQQPEYVPEPVDEQDRLAQMAYGLYLRTPHWYQVRKEALERAEHRCALCNAHTSDLEVHHRTYARRGAERPADVIVLCASCHGRHHLQLRTAS